jgi:6-phosphogluconolactonase
MNAGPQSVQVAADLREATQEALRHFVQAATAAVEQRQRFFFALAGGETPAGLYTQLGLPPYLETLPWDRFELFFGDERCVGPTEPQSNYRMVKRTLLAQAPIPAAHVHRMRGEIDPAAAAEEYERDIRRTFGNGDSSLPRFDFILLGLGPEGHTASLFPHTAALDISDRLAVANFVPQLHGFRLTLTAALLNDAREVLFLISGEEKAEALAGVLQGPHDPQRLPAQLIQPTNGRLTWLVDRAAASKLRPRG